MKTLNDILRAEFQEIIHNKDFMSTIFSEKLDPEIISNAFEILLESKYDPNSIERAKTEFENYIINTLKSKV
jgi:hypothetical protein